MAKEVKNVLIADLSNELRQKVENTLAGHEYLYIIRSLESSVLNYFRQCHETIDLVLLHWKYAIQPLKHFLVKLKEISTETHLLICSENEVSEILHLVPLQNISILKAPFSSLELLQSVNYSIRRTKWGYHDDHSNITDAYQENGHPFS